MEGVVDHHLRKIYADIGGIDACVTEFIRVSQTRLPEKVFRRSCPELRAPLKIPVNVQLLGSNPSLMAFNARKAAKLGAPSIDINFGCPAKTVNKNRGGACLLDEPELIFDIVSSIRKAVPENTPVSAKIRLGYENRNTYLKNALAIEEAGANELFVHARSKADGYKPPAYWSCIGEICQTLKIPVIANGEIWSLEDYKNCRGQSLCDDFMLGRGLLSKPDLAQEIKAFERGEDFVPMSWEALLPLVKELHYSTLDSYPAKYCGNRLKQWLMYLQRQYPEASNLFEDIKRLRAREELEKMLS